ncbi:hypothetical protein E2C01_041036 [Portunus trituberculatus]|uniref:Uncharacterized protein n=1 Tax=Portunus trituberculatus TaxID=210409 RepID=A0A5B7FSE2_PORTR|nr:hypothetical protein [Portunus trituberculatus]
MCNFATVNTSLHSLPHPCLPALSAPPPTVLGPHLHPSPPFPDQEPNALITPRLQAAAQHFVCLAMISGASRVRGGPSGRPLRYQPHLASFV